MNSATLLTPALKGIVVGHWSQDGKLSPEHIAKRHHDIFIYKEEEQLIKQLVETFTYDGQTIIDATGRSKNFVCMHSTECIYKGSYNNYALLQLGLYQIPYG